MKTILNRVSNFIPHETIIFEDRDPPWINTRIKNLINEKKYFIKNIFVAAKTQMYSKNLNYFKIRLLTNDSRDRYYTRIPNKLNDSESILVNFKNIFE